MTVDRKLVPALVGVICGMLAMVGSLGPWASVWIVTVSGMDGDGMLTAVLGFVAIGAFGWHVYTGAEGRKSVLLGLAAFLLIATVGIYDWRNLSNLIDEGSGIFGSAQVGWGLQLVDFAGVDGAIVSVVAIREAGKQPQEVLTDDPPAEAAAG
ncbi:MAG: hypothetical protein ACOC9Y_10480 [Chloroflexota bacterium]